LSLCLVKLNFEDGAVGSDNLTKDRIFHSLGEIFSEEIRSWDTLHRYERQTYVILMPQTSLDEAQDFCNRLERISEKNYSEIEGLRIKLVFGLAELTVGKDETGADLLAKATSVLQKVSS
jgi:GGDEF domain-containing protein